MGTRGDSSETLAGDVRFEAVARTDEGSVMRASRKLKLPKLLAERLILASDDAIEKVAHDPTLRRRLLLACGLRDPKQEANRGPRA